MGFGAKPQARSQGRQPPVIKPLPEGKGFGVRDREFNLSLKYIIFRQSETADFTAVFVYLVRFNLSSELLYFAT